MCMAVPADGKQVVAASAGNAVYIWNLAADEQDADSPTMTFTHSAPVRAAAAVASPACTTPTKRALSTDGGDSVDFTPRLPQTAGPPGRAPPATRRWRSRSQHTRGLAANPKKDRASGIILQNRRCAAKSQVCCKIAAAMYLSWLLKFVIDRPV